MEVVLAFCVLLAIGTVVAIALGAHESGYYKGFIEGRRTAHKQAFEFEGED
ncbi:MAG: hypothetical protein AAF581_11085 [Planctomycetota bacterium]